jgi:Glutamine amidotransferase domain
MVPINRERGVLGDSSSRSVLTDRVPIDMSIPGFVAVASEDGTDVPFDEVDRLAAAYEAICGPASRRASHAAGAFARVIEFRRDDGPGPVTRPGDSWNVAAGVAHGVEGVAAADAALLEGQFALVTYDARSQTFSAATDAFGMFPLFRAARNGRQYFSTSALALAKHLGAAPDGLGLFVFLRTGYHFGARTHWLGVERLEPGQRILFTPNGVRSELYWRPEPDEAVARLDLEASARFCVRTCVESFRNLYANEDTGWADLTGGYDTRLLTLALSRADVRFRTNTVGADWTEDVRIAQEVAEAAGFDWTRLPLITEAVDDFPALFARALAAGNAHLDALELMRVLATHDAKRADLPHLLTGGGGEQFHYHAWQSEFARVGRSTRVNVDNWVRMRLLGSLDTSIFADYPADEVERDLRDRCLAWIAPDRHELNTHQLDRLFTYKMMGHFGAYTGAATSVLPTELPFYLRPVFLSAFSVSYRHRLGHRLMQCMIEDLQPRAAAVRTTRGGPAQPIRIGNVYRFVPYFLRLTVKALEKVTGMHVYRPRAERRTPMSPELRLAALQTVLGEDAESMRSGVLFKAAELDRLFGEAEQPDFARGQIFGRILTVEAALRAVGAHVTSADRP